MKRVIEAINAYYIKKLYLLDTNKLTVIDRLRHKESIFSILSLLEFEFNSPVVAATAFDTADISKKINENFKSFLAIVDENKADVVQLIYTDMKMYDIVLKLKANEAESTSSASSNVSYVSPNEDLILEHLYAPLEHVFKSGIKDKKKNKMCNLLYYNILHLLKYPNDSNVIYFLDNFNKIDLQCLEVLEDSDKEN